MSDLLAAIKSVLTDGDVLSGRDATERLAGIWRSDTIQAEIIVRPTSTAEVAAVMKLCHARNQHVVVHGGLTGLVHAGDTRSSDVVISTERMNRIEELDTLGRTMTLQSGVPLQLVHEAAVCATGIRRGRSLGQKGFERLTDCPSLPRMRQCMNYFAGTLLPKPNSCESPLE